jgi:Arc/MetJ-type ribon-helix-helix transcriptional regulator
MTLGIPGPFPQLKIQDMISNPTNLLEVCFRKFINFLCIKLNVMARGHVIRVFRVKMSEKMASGLEDLVSEGAYVSYADAIRHALARLIEENSQANFREPSYSHPDEIQEGKESSSSRLETPSPS